MSEGSRGRSRGSQQPDITRERLRGSDGLSTTHADSLVSAHSMLPPQVIPVTHMYQSATVPPAPIFALGPPPASSDAILQSFAVSVAGIQQLLAQQHKTHEVSRGKAGKEVVADIQLDFKELPTALQKSLQREFNFLKECFTKLSAHRATLTWFSENAGKHHPKCKFATDLTLQVSTEDLAEVTPSNIVVEHEEVKTQCADLYNTFLFNMVSQSERTLTKLISAEAYTSRQLAIATKYLARSGLVDPKKKYYVAIVQDWCSMTHDATITREACAALDAKIKADRYKEKLAYAEEVSLAPEEVSFAAWCSVLSGRGLLRRRLMRLNVKPLTKRLDELLNVADLPKPQMITLDSDPLGILATRFPHVSRLLGVNTTKAAREIKKLSRVSSTNKPQRQNKKKQSPRSRSRSSSVASARSSSKVSSRGSRRSSQNSRASSQKCKIEKLVESEKLVEIVANKFVFGEVKIVVFCFLALKFSRHKG